MKKGKGGGPISPLKPQRPQRGPSGKAITHNRGSGARKLPQPGQVSSSPPKGIPPVPKPSRQAPLEEDLISSIPVEIDVDFDEPLSSVPPSPQTTEKKLIGHNALLRSISTVLRRLYPKAEGKPLEFTEKRILLDSKEIGKVEKTPVGATVRIWMNDLGFTVDTLPASTIFGFFNISDFFFADAKSKAKFVSIYGESIGKRTTLKICFHREQKPSSFLSAPLRAIKK